MFGAETILVCGFTGTKRDSKCSKIAKNDTFRLVTYIHHILLHIGRKLQLTIHMQHDQDRLLKIWSSSFFFFIHAVQLKVPIKSSAVMKFSKLVKSDSSGLYNILNLKITIYFNPILSNALFLSYFWSINLCAEYKNSFHEVLISLLLAYFSIFNCFSAMIVEMYFWLLSPNRKMFGCGSLLKNIE